MLWRSWLKGTFIPFTPGHMQFFTLVLYFFFSPFFNRSLLFLLVHFGVAVRAMVPIAVILNQLYAHFLSLVHSVSPISALPLPLIFPEKSLSSTVIKSADYSPLIVIFQVFSKMQDGNCPIRRSRSSWLTPATWPEDPLFNGPSDKDPPQQKTLKTPLPWIFFYLLRDRMIVYC